MFMHREHHHHHHHHHHQHQQQQGEVGGVVGVEMDGLLCDVTVEGIQKWVSEVGESSVGVEVGLFLIILVGGIVYLCTGDVVRSRWRESLIRASFLRY
jgi:hypothetical protein